MDILIIDLVLFHFDRPCYYAGYTFCYKQVASTRLMDRSSALILQTGRRYAA